MENPDVGTVWMCNIYEETFWTNFPFDARYQPWPVGTRRFSPSKRTQRNRRRLKRARGTTRRQQLRLPLSTLALCVGYDLSVHTTEFCEVNTFFFFFFEGIEHGGKISEIIRQPLWLFINWLKWRKLKTLWFQFLILEYVLFYMLLLEHVVWECHVWQPASAFFTPLSFSCQKARASTRLFSSLINLPVMCF